MGGIGKMGRIENCLLEWGEFFVINLWYKTTRREVPKMEKHLYFSKLTEKEQRMVMDDDFFDVTKDDVKRLIHRMKIHLFPKEQVIAMRKKYDLWLEDREKRIMDKYGLSYDTHTVSNLASDRRYPGIYSSYKSSNFYFINGYTETEWRMLTDEDYIPTYTALSRFIDICRKYNDQETLDVLLPKYHNMIFEHEGALLIHNGVDPNVKRDTVRWNSIDGMSYSRWKLLHDDNYFPNRSILISTIKQMRDEGYAEDAERIEQKYLTYLYPSFYDTVSKEEIDAANDYFDSLHKRSKD